MSDAFHLYQPGDIRIPRPADLDDAETVTQELPELGVPVDPPEADALAVTWADLTSTGRTRVPILPAWLMSADTRRSTLRALGSNTSYWARFHLARVPKYAAKAAWYTPLGLARYAGAFTRWMRAEEGNWELRQRAASTGDAFTWQALNRTRAREAKARTLSVLVGGTLLLCSGVIAVWSHVVPSAAWLAVGGILALVCARKGRPADRPILDRVSTGPRFTKLTAEMVRNALVALRLPGLTEPQHVDFVHPGIHRDGPGWLARINLPAGMEAVRVMDKRAALSSALRLPVDQVWPTAGPDHAGQLDLWVGYQPASKMSRTAWSLTKPGARTSVFEQHEFGTDERQRPVKTSLFARSFLIGGQPGSGKSYAARALALMAAQDPTVEFKIAEFKGTGDFIDFEPLCSTYVCGVDENALAEGAAILQWVIGEAERRGKRILDAKKRGEAPEGKVTPELARRRGSGLHPIVVLFDEVHELFAWSKDAAENAERAIKRARALNIIIVLATQIPDKTSLPPNITRCVTNRWCLSVAGQVENDMILGTGAYKRGLTGTAYRPEIDAGWGVMTGGPTPASVRSQYPNPEEAARMIANAIALRGGTPANTTETVEARDLLRDLAMVAVSNGQHWTVAAAGFTERWPGAYPTLTAEALSAMARKLGLPSVDVKIAGKVAKGFRRADLDALRVGVTPPTPLNGTQAARID